MSECVTPNDRKDRLRRISDRPEETEQDSDLLRCHPFSFVCQVHEDRILDVHRKSRNERKDIRNEWRDVSEQDRDEETRDHDRPADQQNRFTRCSFVTDP